jgi:hypothetical protein
VRGPPFPALLEGKISVIHMDYVKATSYLIISARNGCSLLWVVPPSTPLWPGLPPPPLQAMLYAAINHQSPVCRLKLTSGQRADQLRCTWRRIPHDEKDLSNMY